MAKADWLKVNPASGSGNANVNVSSQTEHTGRVARTTVLTWKAANVQDVVRSVNQAGKPEYANELYEYFIKRLNPCCHRLRPGC